MKRKGEKESYKRKRKQAKESSSSLFTSLADVVFVVFDASSRSERNESFRSTIIASARIKLQAIKAQIVPMQPVVVVTAALAYSIADAVLVVVTAFAVVMQQRICNIMHTRAEGTCLS